jgi:hypothetical protein
MEFENRIDIDDAPDQNGFGFANDEIAASGLIDRSGCGAAAGLAGREHCRCEDRGGECNVMFTIVRPFGPNCGKNLLLRQANPLAKRLQPWIATNQSEFRIVKIPAEPHRTQRSHALQCLKRAHSVAHTGEGQGLTIRLRCPGSELLGLVPPAGAPVRVPEEALDRVFNTGILPGRSFKYLNGFLNSPLAQTGSSQPLALARKALGQVLAIPGCRIESARRHQRVGQDIAKPGRNRVLL